METENFAGVDLQREYFLTLRATWVAATVGILLAAGWFWLKYAAVGPGVRVFENTVTGGFDALPTLTQDVILHADKAAGIAALGGTGAIVFLWCCGRSIALVIYIGLIAVVCYLISGMAFDVAMTQPLIPTIIHFKG